MNLLFEILLITTWLGFVAGTFIAFKGFAKIGLSIFSASLGLFFYLKHAIPNNEFSLLILLLNMIIVALGMFVLYFGFNFILKINADDSIKTTDETK